MSAARGLKNSKSFPNAGFSIGVIVLIDTGCHCERSEAISGRLRAIAIEIASSLRSSQ